MRAMQLDDANATVDGHKREPSCQAIACLLLPCALAALLLSALSLTMVPPAHVGVVTVLGDVRPKPLPSGVHLVHPFSKVYRFDVRTQIFEQKNHVPTQEGVTVELDVAMLFHVLPARAAELFERVGADYGPKVIVPQVASAVRGLTSERSASALYTSGRHEMQARLESELKETLGPRGLEVESVLLRGVVLPRMLVDAIDKKAQADQEAQRMTYVLDRERREAERKRIEAGGIAEFQRIVSEGISEPTLMWKGIEATQQLAESANAKIVFIGNSKESLPLILGDGISGVEPGSKGRAGGATARGKVEGVGDNGTGNAEQTAHTDGD